MTHILLVDDDKFLIEMYEKKFTNSGFEVTVALSGDEALEMLRNDTAPDCVVMDITMPGTDGLMLLEKLNEEKLAPNALRVMLTNQGADQDVKKAKELGIHGYIVKATAIPSEVVDEVTKIIKKHEKRDES